MRTISLLAALAMFGAAQACAAEPNNPVLGEWDWKPRQGQCPEVHVYRADGTASTRSGDEVLEKTYTIIEEEGGFHRLDMEVVSGNGGKDCLGSTTAVGAKARVYVMPLNDGSYFSCAGPDGMSCFGSARRRKGS